MSDYDEKAEKALEEAREYANTHSNMVPVEWLLAILLAKAVVFALLHISEIIWSAADKMLYPGGYRN